MKRERQNQRNARSTDRLPPHSAEAEMGVLGCVLLSPKECLGECVAAFKGAGAESFYDLRHGNVYGVLVEMWDANEAIDIITLQERLKTKGLLDQVGGVAYLASLPDTVPSAANLGYYTKIVREKFLQRSMLRTLTEGQLTIYESEAEVEEVLDGIEASVLKVNEQRAGEMQSMRELTMASIDLIESAHRGVGLIAGVRTHFSYYDKMTGGLHRKEMIVLAGRPSTGKTSKMVNVAVNVAKIEQLPVGIFSMEMSAGDLNLRMICAEAEVDFHKLRTGFITHAEMAKLPAAAGVVSKLPIFIDDTPALSILALRAKARRLAHQKGIKLILIDYLQLMHTTNRRCNDRQQEIADISGGLKALAKELDVPVVVLSQLNRESAKNKNRKPQLEDLRESGAIEQDADLVEILYEPKDDDAPVDDERREIRVNGLIAKQRNGPTGDVEYLFKRWCMKYLDAYGNRGKERLPTNDELGISAV